MSLLAQDGVDLALGADHYVYHKKFPGLSVQTPMGRSPGLRVSRFYWDCNPPVAVDFVAEVRYGPLELATKRRYFRQRGIHYLWCKDQWDEDGVNLALAALAPDTQITQQIRDAAKPLIGPRRRADDRT